MRNNQKKRQLTQEQQIMEGVIEIDNKIPYQMIQIFRFFQLQRQKKNDEFTITVNIKYKGLPKDENYTITRSLTQIKDLIMKMHKQHSHLLLIPALPQEKGILSFGIKGIQNIFGGDQARKRMEEEEDRQFILSSVRRAFEFIANQSFQFLYINNKPDSPLFVFFQKRCYELYSSKAFEGQSQSTIWEMGNRAVVNTFKAMLPWSQKKIQSPSASTLTEISQKLALLIEQLNKVQQSVKGFCKSIQVLAANFLSLRQMMTKRANLAYQKVVKIAYLKRAVQIRQLQIQQIQRKIQQRSVNKDEQYQQHMAKQLMKYKKYISDQINQFKTQAELLMKKVFELINIQPLCESEERVKIDIGKMYDNYKIVAMNDK